MVDQRFKKYRASRESGSCWLSALWALAVVVALSGMTALSGAMAWADLYEAFEGPEPTWTLADADCAAQLSKHLRQFKDAYRGQGCEHLRLQTGQGSYVYLSHEVTAAPIIDELKVSLWVKSDRPGIQLRLRVVLPRTEDPRTGKPITTFLVGSSYQQPETWQQLTVEHPVLLLQRQQAVLRSQFGQQVDVRQAYVDRIVLNAYGGSAQTNLWIDDLELDGFVATRIRGESLPLVAPQLKPTRKATLEMAESGSMRGTAPREQPRVNGSQLLVGHKPFLPRVVRYSGQSLIEIKDLGFNTVLLSQPPTAAQISDAQALGLWLITPPPLGPSAGRWESQLPTDWQSLVLAWRLDEEQWQQQAMDLRQSEPAWTRPLLTVGHDQWSQRSRAADLVLADQRVAGRGEGVSQGRREQWQQVARQIRPGSHWWATIACPQGIEDLRATIGSDLRRAVFEAITVGARGIVFEYSLQDQQHPDWPATAAMLRAMNAELQLLDPWIAGGRGVECLGNVGSGHRLWVLATDRARLLVAMEEGSSLPEGGVGTAKGWGAGGSGASVSAAGSKFSGLKTASVKSSGTSFTEMRSADRARGKVVSGTRGAPLTVIDHGAPTSADAYVIHGADFRPLQRRRVAGGIEVTVPEPTTITLVVLTQEPLVVNYLARTLNDRRLSFRP
jgi:hypothetical protein